MVLDRTDIFGDEDARQEDKCMAVVMEEREVVGVTVDGAGMRVRWREDEPS